MSRQRTSKMEAGFTLVEVIISISLGAAIMVGLWTVFDIFSALQERADTQAARAQLTRGLLHQLRDDLNQVQTPAVGTSQVRSDRSLTPSTVEDATENIGFLATNESAADQVAERIAFFGSQSWLVMDLAQSSYDQKIETANVAQTTGSPATYSPTRRVVYHFVAPEFAILHGSLDSGLTRWELSNPPTQLSDLIDELERGEWGSPNSIVWQTTNYLTTVDVGEQAPHAASQALTAREQVPEVERFLFRYYDGTSWHSTWDSRRNGSLPRAVECLLVWRDRNEMGAATPNVPKMLEPAEIREELLEMSVLNAWENLGQQDNSATLAQLPKGFVRYVLCLPAALPPQRHFADTSAVSWGQR